MSYPNRLRRALQEDGLYLFAARRIGRPIADFRNFMIGRKLGVQRIHIGAQANLHGLSSIDMGEDFTALDGLWLHAVTRYYDQRFSPRIVIGDRVRVSQWVHIAATHWVEIGDDVLIGSKVTIIDHNHGQYSREHSSPQIAPAFRRLDSDRRVMIGKKVWLGDGVVATPGSSIGEGAVICANSVVRGSIPPFSLACGIPAKVLKIFDFKAERWVSVD
jgi:acetyltransferase-like isoleucine patch superfamily enzyme